MAQEGKKEMRQQQIIYNPNSVAYREINERRVLEFLRTHNQFDYTEAEIAKCLDFKYAATIRNTMRRLSRQSKVTRVRMVHKDRWTWQLIDWINSERYDELNRRW